MNTKLLLYGFATALSLLVVFFIIAFVIDINRVEIPNNLLQEDMPQEAVQKPVTDKSNWTVALKRDKADDFYYPVTEVSISLNLLDHVDQAYKNRLRHFKLHTQKLNNYHYFCLKQVLDQSSIKHKIERFDDEIGVILYSQSQKTLSYVVDELKKYGIASSVKEIQRN